MDLAKEVLAGNRLALAKLITLLENQDEKGRTIMQELYSRTGRAYVLGITGSPGAGKSSLADVLTKELRNRGFTVGIIAIDPTSPFTGGALLGDRIRMQGHVLDEGVFIRSMGTRGSLGGLARATKEAIKAMDAFGKDYILVETVGVGQSELDVMNAADTTLVVLTPQAGDVIQTLKAGIMEIADVFVVNKADLDGASRTVAEVETTLDMDKKRDWRPPVVMSVSLTGKGIPDIYEAIGRHRGYLQAGGRLDALRQKRLGNEVLELVVEHVRRGMGEKVKSPRWHSLMEQVARREINPYAASQTILQELSL